MKNFPKYINTKQDILNLLHLFPREAKVYLKNCISGYKNWVPICEYNEKEECKEDSTHDFIEQEQDGKVKYIQREFKVVPGNDLDRLGISLEEAERLIN